MPITDQLFTANELSYLTSQPLGRLATIGRDGTPHVVPLGFSYNEKLGTIDLTGRDMGRSHKYRNVQHDPRVAFVVDDVPDPENWQVRCIEIRGVAEALTTGGRELQPHTADEMIRIRPTRIVAWGIDAHCEAGFNARDVVAGA